MDGAAPLSERAALAKQKMAARAREKKMAEMKEEKKKQSFMREEHDALTEHEFAEYERAHPDVFGGPDSNEAKPDKIPDSREFVVDSEVPAAGEPPRKPPTPPNESPTDSRQPTSNDGADGIVPRPEGSEETGGEGRSERGRMGSGGIKNINLNNTTVIVGTGQNAPANGNEGLTDAEHIARLVTMNSIYINDLARSFPGLPSMDATPPPLHNNLAIFKRDAVVRFNSQLESIRSPWRVVEGPKASARLYFYNINKEIPPAVAGLSENAQSRISALMKQSEQQIRTAKRGFSMAEHVQNLNNQLVRGTPAITSVHFEAPLAGFPTVVRLVGGQV